VGGGSAIIASPASAPTVRGSRAAADLWNHFRFSGIIEAMKPSAALETLDALAHATRLAAFRALVVAGADGLAVGDLRDRVRVPPATLTAHLNVLRAAKLVLDRRVGRHIVVRANFRRMNDLVAYLSENCCAGGASCGPGVICPPA
jgi:DNA-binding transcriptional ArsR family regulator